MQLLPNKTRSSHKRLASPTNFPLISKTKNWKYAPVLFLVLLTSTLISYILVRRTPDFSQSGIPRNEKTLKKLLESPSNPPNLPINYDPSKPNFKTNTNNLPDFKPETDFIKDAVITPYTEDEIEKSTMATNKLSLHKEVGYPLISVFPENDEIPEVPAKPTSPPKLSVSILREKGSSLISFIPITKFSSYPFPKTEDNLFERIQSKNPVEYTQALDKLKNMCGTTTFFEFLFNDRVYLDNSSLKLKWPFCHRDFFESRKSVALTQLHPCADFMFVVKMNNMFISKSHCFEYCLSMIDKSANKYFNFQTWFHPPRKEDVTAKPIHYDKVAYAYVSPYYDSFGHFSSEALFYLIYLLRVLPKDVRVIACSTSICGQYIKYLGKLPGDPFHLNYTSPDPEKRRIITLNPKESFFVKELYLASSYPNCQDEATKIYSRESVLLTQEAFLKEFYEEQSNKPTKRHILVIDRSDATMRTIQNHAEMVETLRAAFPNEIIKEFKASNVKELKDVISYFFYSKMVIAPHGAGLTHLLWCQPGTKVIEIGFDSGDFPLPSTYYGLSVAASLDYYLTIGRGSLFDKYMIAPIPSVVQLAYRALKDFNTKFEGISTGGGNMLTEQLNASLKKDLLLSLQQFTTKYFDSFASHPHNIKTFNEFLSKVNLPRIEEKLQISDQKPEMQERIASNLQEDRKILAYHYLVDLSQFFSPKKADYKKTFLMKQIVLSLIRSQIQERLTISQKNSKNSNLRVNTVFLTLITQHPDFVMDWLRKDWKKYFNFEKLDFEIMNDKNEAKLQAPEALYFSPTSESNRVRLYIKNVKKIDSIMRNIQTRDSQYLPSFFDIRYSIIQFDSLDNEGVFPTSVRVPIADNSAKYPLDRITFVDECSRDEEKLGEKSKKRLKILKNSKYVFTFSKGTANCLEKTYNFDRKSNLFYFEKQLYPGVFKPLSDIEITERKKNFALEFSKPFFIVTSASKVHNWNSFERALRNIQMSSENSPKTAPELIVLGPNYLGIVPEKRIIPVVNHADLDLMYSLSLGLVDFGDEITLSIMECLASGAPVVLAKELKNSPFFTQSGVNLPKKGIYFVERDENEIKETLLKVQLLTREERIEISKELSSFINKKKLSFVEMTKSLFSVLIGAQKHDHEKSTKNSNNEKWNIPFFKF